jgi:thiol-disulfide isomerase/thioredoxin
MKKFVIWMLFLGWVPSLWSATLSGRILDYPKEILYLTGQKGLNQTLLDSSRVDSQGRFQFTNLDSLQRGFYSLVIPGHRSSLDFIWDQSSFVLTTDFGALTDSVEFENSIENTLYTSFTQKNEMWQKRLSLIRDLYTLYQQDTVQTPFESHLLEEYDRLETSRMQTIRNLSQRYPDMILTRWLLMALVPDRGTHPDGSQYSDRTAFLKDHYFDTIDFQQTWLVTTTLFPRKLVDYLNLYDNTTSSLSKAVDHIFSHALANDTLYEFTLEFLLDYFERQGRDEMVLYLTDTYGLTGCENKELVSRLQDTKMVLESLQVGKPAPEFSLETMTGDTLALSEIDANYIVVYFWSSECGHCQRAIPVLKSLYRTFHSAGVEFIGISTDTDRQTWLSWLNTDDMPWIHMRAGTSWHSSVLERYHVVFTPSYYLLGPEKRIQARPRHVQQLKTELETQTNQDT